MNRESMWPIANRDRFLATGPARVNVTVDRERETATDIQAVERAIEALFADLGERLVLEI